MPSIINATTTTGLVSSADNSGSLQLATNNGTTALTIDTSQNVGIGTTSPTSIVETAKAAANTQVRLTESSDSGSDTALFYARRSRGTSLSSPTAIQSGNNMGGLAIGAYNGTSYAIGSRIIGISNQTWTGSAQGTYLTFSTTADGATSDTERMRITSGGDLCINSTVSNATGLSSGYLKIDMNNTSRNGFVIDNVTQNYSAIAVRKQSTTGASYSLYMVNSAGNYVGGVEFSNTATSYLSASDYRLKENVAPMTGALETVAQLKPVTYKWKSDGSNGQGFIAHELQAVVPECVSGIKDAVETYTDEDGNEQTKPKYQGIDTSFLVATLTAAIQELKAELDATKAEVQALKGVA